MPVYLPVYLFQFEFSKSAVSKDSKRKGLQEKVRSFYWLIKKLKIKKLTNLGLLQIAEQFCLSMLDLLGLAICLGNTL